MEELDQTHVDMVLKTHIYGRLGCYADGKVYVVPITYVYQDGYAYTHTNDGMKVAMMRKNPEVCLEVDDIKAFNNWQSVIAWGTFEELDGKDAANALSILSTRLGEAIARKENKESAEVDLDEVDKAMRLHATKGVIYRIALKEKTGRFERPGMAS